MQVSGVPSRLCIKEAHEKLMQGLRIQLLLIWQLILKESSPHNVAAQKSQCACLYGLVNPS